MANPMTANGGAGRAPHHGPAGSSRASAVAVLATCLLAASACATHPRDVTVVDVPLGERQIEGILDEAGGREAEIQLERSLRPRPLNATLWAFGSDSLRYVPSGRQGQPVSVALRDVSWLAFPRGRGEMAVRGAFRGGLDGALRGLFEEGFCSGSFLPDCRADYGRALESGAFSGAAIGFLGGLIGGDRDPPTYTFTPGGR